MASPLHVERYDPWEQKNLADKPEHAAIQCERLQRLYRHLAETADPMLAGAVIGPHRPTWKQA